MQIAVHINTHTPPPLPKPEPYRVLTVPNDGGRYMLLADDWDTAQWDHKARSHFKGYKSDPPWNGLPATVQTQKSFYALNEQWQRFYFELCRLANGYSVPMEDMLNSYRNLTRDSGGWRDQHTWDHWRNERDKVPHDKQKIFTDYVLGLNLPPAHNEGDAEQQDLLSSGNIVKVLGEINNDYIIETLNYVLYDEPHPGASPVRVNSNDTKYLLDPPAVDDVWGKWWLVGWATVSGYRWATDDLPAEKRRMKWPRFGGYGCPLMFLGRDGKNRVAKYWCKPIANGAEFSPYMP